MRMTLLLLLLRIAQGAKQHGEEHFSHQGGRKQEIKRRRGESGGGGGAMWTLGIIVMVVVVVVLACVRMEFLLACLSQRGLPPPLRCGTASAYRRQAHRQRGGIHGRKGRRGGWGAPPHAPHILLLKRRRIVSVEQCGRLLPVPQHHQDGHPSCQRLVKRSHPHMIPTGKIKRGGGGGGEAPQRERRRGAAQGGIDRGGQPAHGLKEHTA